MNNEETLCKRKERRFKTCEENGLKCLVFVDVNEPVSGTVIDVSPSGLRLLVEGRPNIGDPFITELTSNRLHGVFPGIIRRVTPWVDGKYVLGVQLLETIPDSILETLANESVINRRGGDRVEWRQPAIISWELNTEDVEIEIQDCSRGGLKLFSKTKLPMDANMRILVQVAAGEEMVMEGVTVWERKADAVPVEGWHYGLAFTRKEIPAAVRKVLGELDPVEDLPPRPKKIITAPNDDDPILSQCLLVMAAIVVLTVGVMQTGILQ